MKFTDGNWLVKEGMKIYGGAEIVDVKMADDAWKYYCQNKKNRRFFDELFLQRQVFNGK